MSDKRQIDRVRTILAAQAILGKGLANISCLVKDLSNTGARIVLEDGHALLPDHFELHIPKKSMTRKAEVRWREGQVIGIAFADQPRTAGISLEEHVRTLEAENAELRRRVAEMAERLYAYGDSERFSI